MRTSPKGRALIEAFEGRYLKAYRDSVNVLTIGYGHTSAAGEPYVSEGMTITEADADSILATDLGKVEKQVEHYVTKPLNQAQFDALVSFTFNLGQGNLASSSLCRRINAGDYDVSNEFLKWNRAGGQVLTGLTRRRRAEAAMWSGDVSGALKIAGVAVPPPDVVPLPTPKPDTVGTKHVAAGSAGAATAGAMHISGMPLWACVLGAVGIAIIVYIIMHNRSKS